MGFIIRSAAVIGLIYLASPLRPPMPEWLARPELVTTPLAANSPSKNQDLQSLHQSAVSAPSKGPETISIAALKATMETAGRAVAVACSGHEKSCIELAARAAKATTDVDPLAALIGPDTAHATPAHDASHPQSQIAEAVPAPTIPLPPRREAEPQKKI